MSLNKVITSVNALVNNVSIPSEQLNNVVCIDVENNRIGVKNGNPEYEIDISGTINTNFININNQNNPIDSFDISYQKTFLRFSRGLQLMEDLSCNNINAKQIISDISFTNNVDIHGDLSCNAINTKLIISDISFTKNVDIHGDLSCNAIISDISFTKNVDIHGDLSCNSIISDISFTKNVDINIDLRITGDLYTPGGVVKTSDDRYKHNEKIITNGLEIIRKLQPQTYDKTKTFKDIDFQGVVNEPHIREAGLIAQELYAINDLSFTVFEGDNNNPYYVRYDDVFIFGLAAVKELDTIVSNLSEKVSNLSNESGDISNTNVNNIPNTNVSNIYNTKLSNLLGVVKNQNALIQSLNEKITSLESRIINLE
jgi:hypothetical protein